MKRVYHPYELWEEMRFNMWGTTDDRRAALNKAIAFTADHKLYGSYMLRVVNEWPISCENALTDSNINQRAWVGHAACALALNIPEDITRKAWGALTNEQRLLANKEADRAINVWRINYGKSERLSATLDQPLLF